MDFDNIKNDNKTLNFLTGISNVHIFKWLLSLVKPNVELTTKSITHQNHFIKLYCMARKGSIT